MYYSQVSYCPSCAVTLPLQSYKLSMRNILTAARVNTGPLWRAQAGGVATQSLAVANRCPALFDTAWLQPCCWPAWPRAAATRPAHAARCAPSPPPPAWLLQRQLNAKYRLLEEQQAEREEEQGLVGPDEAPLARPHKSAGKAKGAGGKGGKGGGRDGRGGRKGAARQRLVGSDSDSELEDTAGDEAAAVAAADAMEKLMLATARKVGRGTGGVSGEGGI